ncbi:MAG: UDP-N-acetylmuramoyl-L-alanyl-D-glutamate--2,6-diaminopimelate ligase [Acidimicrobiales bacterium]|nr:UDP-N-acetylmuramoyl-L-alanyl-D-glutamate--2,6-diaminopimelate ligase [Acidimicrobiales bacterium]
MRLRDLLAGVDARVEGDADVDVAGVTHDSRAVGPGDLFCCLPGEHHDGHDFAPAALERGAVALLCERHLALDVTQVIAASARESMAPIAATLHGDPSRSLTVVGVTGTNGKTTTTHLLAAVLEANGWPTAVLGTLSGARTTPEATELQALLADMRDGGRRAVAMEVSSHALALHRVDATWFEAAVFTNLGRDHLDFHGNVERYFAAKASLFEPERTAVGVVNLDDPYGRLLLDAARVPTVGYALADAGDVVVHASENVFTWSGRRLHVPLGGRFNLHNALAAATTARELGVGLDAIEAGLAAVTPVPGRFEPVDAGQPFRVIVDYAHTPDGMEGLLRSAREVAAGGRVLVVFGCGGDRDREKRPAMGAVAERFADLVVLTSDNPRSEEPAAIIEAVRAGMDRRQRALVEPDRRAAISLAVRAARPGDVVVIAGKGHESTQVTGDVVAPFDDRVVARQAIAALESPA